jgi:hypothetical protein
VHPVSQLYGEMKEFIDRFIGTKHPNTICWLLEILNILTDKFSVSSGSEGKDFEKKKKALKPCFERLLYACE